ncbi:MAG TPA: DUF2309 domain-containing protein [Rhodanobacteraceae bacterium]
MTRPEFLRTPYDEAFLRGAIDEASKIIAPNWPLDRQIAVNPWWGLVDKPFAEVDATLRRLSGTRMALAAADYRRAWQRGEILPADLARAIEELRAPLGVDTAVAALDVPTAPSPALPLLSDLVAAPHMGTELRYGDIVTQQVSQHCASYFDERQADWRRPREALFAGWLAGLASDNAIELSTDAPAIRRRARELPREPMAAIAFSLDGLRVPAAETIDWLRVVLLRINGWASWCAYLAWEARLHGRTDAHLTELLAIRVAWEALLDDGRRDAACAWARWRAAWARAASVPAADAVPIERVWQRAHEVAYQRGLLDSLAATKSLPRSGVIDEPPKAHFVFCIDVRSERIRRALEAVDPTLRTSGFAGFFGLPIRHAPIGLDAPRTLVPGLLAPSLDASETTGSPEQDAHLRRKRARALRVRRALEPFLRLPTGAFAFVETLGAGYLARILARLRHGKREAEEPLGLSRAEARRLRPCLLTQPPDDAERTADLVASILRGMSLTQGFAKCLVLVGHGSETRNNPLAAGLDCGACGGHSGETSARLLADLLNDAVIRAKLRTRGIDIPQDTLAIGALHNTTTDEVRLFAPDTLSTEHGAAIAELRAMLERACERVRDERAPKLGLSAETSSASRLRRSLRRRARDWSETRPEWGLANNAAMIVAPRSRTRGVDLDGRAFLHDYDWRADPNAAILESIMSAPMIVAHWINLQYFASTVAPRRFGSGNKILHNVVGGHIGVFEGNTGDLRIGLPRQSVHDGRDWTHAPLRLSVVVDAPRAMIVSVLARSSAVRDLVRNEWLYLFRIDDSGIERYRIDAWEPEHGEKLPTRTDSHVAARAAA